MPYNRSQKLTQQTAELAIAAPQVIAHRWRRMALSGAKPSTKDLRECYAMGAEKIVAVQQSCMAMSSQLTRANQRLVLSMFAAKRISTTRKVVALFSPFAVQRTVLDVLNNGIAQFRKKAVANAKRLSRK